MTTYVAIRLSFLGSLWPSAAKVNKSSKVHRKKAACSAARSPPPPPAVRRAACWTVDGGSFDCVVLLEVHSGCNDTEVIGTDS